MNPTHPTLAARMRRRSACVLTGLGLVLLVAGCGALPERPQRAALYDFGPGPLGAAAAAPAGAPALPTIALAEIESNPRLEGTQLLYRLGYADANELRPYGRARWSMAPAQLLRQRLRETLAQRRTVLGPEESATMARGNGGTPDTLRIALDEFSHYFESPGRSVGLVRLRATLIRQTPGGDRVLGQKSVTVQRPASTADAPGGVQALAAASNAAALEIVEWVDQTR